MYASERDQNKTTITRLRKITKSHFSFSKGRHIPFVKRVEKRLCRQLTNIKCILQWLLEKDNRYIVWKIGRMKLTCFGCERIRGSCSETKQLIETGMFEILEEKGFCNNRKKKM